MPRKIKYRKQQRGKMAGSAKRGSSIAFGKHALKSMERGWVSAREIESARRAITRFIKREGQVWIRIFPDKPITSRPPETRMGKGKGPLDHFAATVKPGRIIFEMDGVSNSAANKALALAAYKLSVKTKIIKKDD